MRTVKTTIMAAAIIALAGFAAPALADTPPAAATSASAVPQSYAFVDMMRIMHETSAGKSVSEEIINKKKQIKAEIDKKVQAVRDEDEALDKQRSTLSKEEYAAKKQAIGQKIDDIRKFSNDHGNAFDAAANDAMVKIRDLAGDAIETVAQRHQYAAVFSREAVIIGAKNLDITDEVIKEMNQNGKKVSVDWSAKAEKK